MKLLGNRCAQCPLMGKGIVLSMKEKVEICMWLFKENCNSEELIQHVAILDSRLNAISTKPMKQ